MSTGDVEAIGKHCQYEYCNVLDFLPFPCQRCKKHYCLDHRTEYAHKCSPSDTADSRSQTSRNGTPEKKVASSGGSRGHSLLQPGPCTFPPCESIIDTDRAKGIECPRCLRRYCITHRHEETHDCKNIPVTGTQPNIVQQHAQSALSRLKIWAEKKRKDDEMRRSAPKKSGFLGLGKSSNSSAAVTAQVELNALKRAAKGDAKVPPEKRIYLHVEASSDTTKAKFPTGKFFYSKDISVGRVLDMAAKALQVENVNNRGGGEEAKLRVFHVQGGRLLRFSEKIGDPCQNGNMIILMRGVGAGDPDLIDL